MIIEKHFWLQMNFILLSVDCFILISLLLLYRFANHQKVFNAAFINKKCSTLLYKLTIAL